MTPAKKRILIIVPLVIVAAAFAVYIALGKDTREILSYFAWKAFSADSGKGRYADVNGHSIYYEIHGHGEPLLLLHGGTAFIESFYMQIPALAKEFRVIAVDSRGHGRSPDSAKTLGYASMAADMAALLDSLGIRRAFVVGWSDGGIMGIDLAFRRPDLVKRLVAIGANYRADGLTAGEIEKTKTMTADDEGLAPVRDFYGYIAPDPGHWPVLVEKVKAMWLAEPQYTNAELARITAPALIIAGEHDMIRKEHTLEMSRLIRGSRCEIIPGASHRVPLEKPELINGMIISFLRGDGNQASP
jgi:pimeloyl-ACP methyl ester carboxylesterase